MQRLPSSRSHTRGVLAPARERHRGMQAFAWLSLVAAVGLLAAAILYLPRGVAALLSGVSESRPISATVLEGTVLVQPPATATWQGMASQADLAEGTRLLTDDRSRAFLRTREGSTVLLYNDAELAVQRMQYGRFNPSPAGQRPATLPGTRPDRRGAAPGRARPANQPIGWPGPSRPRNRHLPD